MPVIVTSVPTWPELGLNWKIMGALDWPAEVTVKDTTLLVPLTLETVTA